MKTILAFAILGSTTALCPDACSGHGQCGQYDKCACYANYMGVSCAEKKCPYTVAWSDTGAHAYAECGNRGTCNRETGVCECYDGFEGKGCARLSCIEGCSGHGTCETFGEVNSGYTGWDEAKIMHCNCDPGFTGPDCSERMCMPGDDPMSVRNEANPSLMQTNEVQTLTINAGDGANYATGSFTLKFIDWRGEIWETWPIELVAANPTGIEIEEALEALPNHAIPSVTVTYTGNAVNRVWEIEFSDPANSGNIPALQVMTGGCTVVGCQPYYAGLTIGTNSGDAAIPTVTSVDGTTENYICSGRGECDTDTGLCECHDGYTGQACESQTIIM